MAIRRIYENRFSNGNPLEAEWHIIGFDRICGTVHAPKLDLNVLNVKLFPHSLTGPASTWFGKIPKGNLKS